MLFAGGGGVSADCFVALTLDWLEFVGKEGQKHEVESIESTS
jgi:hypothetical protein